MSDMFNNWETPESEDRLDLVFEHRNRKYGAYQIRKAYSRTKVIAMAVACAIALLLAGTPLVIAKMGKENTSKKKKVKFDVVSIDKIPKKKEEEKKQAPPPKPPPPAAATQQYTVPKIDPNTKAETPIVPPDLVNKAGTKTKKGSKDPFAPDIPKPGGGRGPVIFDDKPPVKAEIEATFIGGMDKFRDYVRDHFNYPERCQEEGINGAVLLEFVVDIKGKISNVRMISETAACPEFTTEAIRVLKESPRWMPGQTNGTFVKSYRTIPIQLTVGN